MNTQLHAVTDAREWPIKFFMAAGRVSDDTGAAALLNSAPASLVRPAHKLIRIRPERDESRSQIIVEAELLQ